MNKDGVQTLIKGYVAVHFDDIMSRKEGAAEAALDYARMVFDKHLTEDERVDCKPESVLYYELFNCLLRSE